MKINQISCLQLGLGMLAMAVMTGAISVDRVNRKRQAGHSQELVDSSEDGVAEASGFHGAAAGGVQGHSKYFQDFFTAQLAPYKIEFGHVCEDPDDWEERYERNDFKDHRYQGKVRWGDKHGGHGEHYWDYNHGGHGGKHGDSNDEGSDAVADFEQYQEEDQSRKKREQPAQALFMDEATGEVVDQATGRKYILQEIY